MKATKSANMYECETDLLDFDDRTTDAVCVGICFVVCLLFLSGVMLRSPMFLMLGASEVVTMPVSIRYDRLHDMPNDRIVHYWCMEM